MFLVNTSNEAISFRWNSTPHTIEPGGHIDIKKDMGAKTEQEEMCIAEKFEKETERRLIRAMEAQNKPTPTIKEPEKVEPKSNKEEKSDGKHGKYKKGGKK